MAMDLQYKPFSGVGVINFFRRNAVTGALVGGGYDMGEGSKLAIGNNAPKVELATSRSADRGTAFSMAQAKSGSVTIELRTLNDFVLGLLTGGTWSEQAAAGAPVTNFMAPEGLVAGQVIKLPGYNLTNVSLRDSTEGAAQIVPPAQYELDPVGGTIKLLDIATGGPFVQPFNPVFTPGATKTLGAYKAPDEDFYIHFNGTNAQDGSRMIVEVYKFRFAPEGEFNLIETEYGTYQLSGSIQKDTTRTADAAGGQYYKMVMPLGA